MTRIIGLSNEIWLSGCARVGSDIEMNDLSSMMTKNNKAVKNPEGNCWYSKEINNYGIFGRDSGVYPTIST